MNQPVVSICCITYNHVDFIKECIEGFISQKTNFSIEILIFDDASTDGTQEIIKEYASKHKNIITFLQSENQWKKNKYGLLDFLFPNSKGKYIALCEGDDYWTDPYKLQKQFDLIEKYPNASMCVALNKQVFEQTGKEKNDRSYNGKHFPLIYFNSLTQYFHTSTYFIRKSTLDLLVKQYQDLFLGDTALRYLLINEGPFVVLNEVVSVYRITGSGIWTSLKLSDRFINSHKLYKVFRKKHKSNHTLYYYYKEITHLGVGILLKIWESIKR